MTNYGADYLSRQQIAALPFKSVGGNVHIHPRVVLVGIENIAIGSNVRIDPDVIILATGPVEIGSYIHIGAQCYLAGGGGITLSNFTNLSQGVKLYSTSDDYSGACMTNPMIPPELSHPVVAPIVLREHVIIGSGSVVLPGVTLEEGTAIGALSLVTQSTKPWMIYGGTPARALKARRKDALAIGRQLIPAAK